MPDLPNRVNPTTNLSDNLAIINDAFDQIDAESQTKIIRNGNTPTVLIGKQTSGFNGQDYGVKVAKPGYNVTAATDDQLAFSSAFNNLKVVAQDDITLSISGGSGSAVIPHGLGVVPAVLAYSTRFFDGTVTGYYWVLAPWDWSSGTDYDLLNVGANETELYFEYSSNISSPATKPIRYYLLAETLG